MTETIDNIADNSDTVGRADYRALTKLLKSHANRRWITEFGDIVLGIGTIFDGEISFPLDAVSTQSVVDGLDRLVNSETLERIKEISAQVELLNEGNKSRDDVSLAARGFHHDSTNLYNDIYFGYHIVHNKLNMLKQKPKMLEKASFVNGLYSDLEHFRLLAFSIVYLVSGGADSRFVTYVNSSQLEYLLGRKRNNNFKLTRKGIPIPVQGLIPSPVYAAANQLAKNAKSDYVLNYKRYKKSNGKSNGEIGYDHITIKDQGTGLLDRNGLQLAAERFYKIFGEFTTKDKEGGLGLQVVKRLMELSRGYIEVTSRAQDGNVYKYNTRMELKHLGPMPRFKGTEFRLYFPTAQSK